MKVEKVEDPFCPKCERIEREHIPEYGIGLENTCYCDDKQKKKGKDKV